jgi:hypothetical protein
MLVPIGASGYVRNPENDGCGLICASTVNLLEIESSKKGCGVVNRLILARTLFNNAIILSRSQVPSHKSIPRSYIWTFIVVSDERNSKLPKLIPFSSSPPSSDIAPRSARHVAAVAIKISYTETPTTFVDFKKALLSLL